MLEPIATIISILLMPVTVILMIDIDCFNSAAPRILSRHELFMGLLLFMCIPQAVKTVLLWLARISMA